MFFGSLRDNSGNAGRRNVGSNDATRNNADSTVEERSFSAA